MKHKKKLYLVKREVFATTIKEAMTNDGIIYEISLAEEKFQPASDKPVNGFAPRKI